jgi:hypothetical protein
MSKNLEQPVLNIPTIAAISIVTWALFAVLHEMVGHGGTAILLGEKVQGAVTTTVHITDFYDLNHVINRIGWWGFRTVASAGTFVNFITGVFALLLLGSKRVTQASTRYFLWFFASVSIFQQAFWLTVMPFAGLGGDWTAFFIELEPSIIWKSFVTIFGIVMLWVGVYLPIRLFKPFSELTMASHRDMIRKMTIIPIFIAFITQILSVLWSPLSGPRHTTIVSIFSFFPLILWLAVVNLIQWPSAPASVQIFRLNRSNIWLVISFIAFFLFVFVLGTGVGSFAGHPDY